jgi:hypothetical protein
MSGCLIGRSLPIALGIQELLVKKKTFTVEKNKLLVPAARAVHVLARFFIARSTFKIAPHFIFLAAAIFLPDAKHAVANLMEQ